MVLPREAWHKLEESVIPAGALSGEAGEGWGRGTKGSPRNKRATSRHGSCLGALSLRQMKRLLFRQGSGRAGAGRCGRSQGRWPVRRPGGGGTLKRPREDVLHQIGHAAAVADDDDVQFLPQRMARHDAEIAADVGDHGADRATADHRVKPGGMPRRRSARAWACRRGRSPRWAARWRRGQAAVRGSARRRGPGVDPGGVAGDPGFECLGTEQAEGDARENSRDIAGAERMGVAAEPGGELPAVVDERMDEADEAAGAAVPTAATCNRQQT